MKELASILFAAIILFGMAWAFSAGIEHALHVPPVCRHDCSGLDYGDNYQ